MWGLLYICDESYIYVRKYNVVQNVRYMWGGNGYVSYLYVTGDVYEMQNFECCEECCIYVRSVIYMWRILYICEWRMLYICEECYIYVRKYNVVQNVRYMWGGNAYVSYLYVTGDAYEMQNFQENSPLHIHSVVHEHPTSCIYIYVRGEMLCVVSLFKGRCYVSYLYLRGNVVCRSTI